MLLKKISDVVYSRSIKEGNYYSAYFALYFAIKYKFELSEYDNAAVIGSDDCLLKFFALVYCGKKNKTRYLSSGTMREAFGILAILKAIGCFAMRHSSPMIFHLMIGRASRTRRYLFTMTLLLGSMMTRKPF